MALMNDFTLRYAARWLSVIIADRRGRLPQVLATLTVLSGVAAWVVFLERDAFQCGYCTPGQIMSCVGLLDEAKRGVPSAVTADLHMKGSAALTDEEIRERMSGNICRCGAYVNIVAAVRDAAGAPRTA